MGMESCKTRNALVLTSFAGFGDILYLTPTLRVLSKLYANVDVWCRNTEPFLNNPNVRNIYKLDRATRPMVYDFYFSDVYIITGEKSCSLSTMPQSNYHATDFFSIGALKIVLRDKEKNLTLVWKDANEKKARDLVKAHGLITNESKDANFTMISPIITWKSRTLPLEFYKNLIKKIQDYGDKVVIVGKNIDYKLYDPDDPKYPKHIKADMDKTMYDISEFPGCIDLTNQLNLHELAALYSLSKSVINSENGNMVISCTNNNCWNIYIPTLTAPEFRIPHRLGDCYYKTIVVGNDDDYYPASNYLVTDLMGAEIKIPSPEKVFSAYKKADECFKSGITKI